MYKLTLGLGLNEYGGVGGFDSFNFCVKVGDNASSTLRGMHPTLIAANVGEVDPTHTQGGILIYSFYWDITTGKFIMQFGVSGDEKLPNTVQIIAQGENKLAFQFNELEEYYTVTDKDVSDSIITPVGDDLCFMFYPVPDLTIRYKYIELKQDSITKERYFENFSDLSPIYQGKANGGSWIVPNTEGINYPILDNGNSGYFYYLDYTTQKLKSLSGDGSLGENIVINGDFSDGENNWSHDPEVTQSVVDEELVVDSSDGWKKSYQDINLIIDKTYLVSCKLKKQTGDVLVEIATTYGFGNTGAVSSTTFTIEEFKAISPHTTTGQIRLQIQEQYGGIGVFDDISVMESLPDSTVYNLTDTHQLVWNCTKALTPAEVAQVERYPDIMYKVIFNSESLVDGFTLSDIGNIYGGNENDQDQIFDLSTNGNDVTILGTYSTSNRLYNTLLGASNLLLNQDGFGKALSTTTSGEVAVDDSNKNISTGWVIGGDFYTITQIISGLLEDLDVDGNGLGTFTQRQEDRRFVKDLDNGNSYYIEDVLQGYTPPEPTGELKAERIASIGHSDTVTRHHGEPVVYSRAVHP